jgi:hypothetical protein
MTGTNCDLFTHNQSRSYLNHLVYKSQLCKGCVHDACKLNWNSNYTFWEKVGTITLVLTLRARFQSTTPLRKALEYNAVPIFRVTWHIPAVTLINIHYRDYLIFHITRLNCWRSMTHYVYVLYYHAFSITAGNFHILSQLSDLCPKMWHLEDKGTSWRMDKKR